MKHNVYINYICNNYFNIEYTVNHSDTEGGDDEAVNYERDVKSQGQFSFSKLNFKHLPYCKSKLYFVAAAIGASG